jgi:hypothetical protein
MGATRQGHAESVGSGRLVHRIVVVEIEAVNIGQFRTATVAGNGFFPKDSIAEATAARIEADRAIGAVAGPRNGLCINGKGAAEGNQQGKQ